MNRLLKHSRRTYSLEAELGLVAVVLVVWHALRIPLEGDVTTSLAHAHDVLRLEQWLGIDVERSLIEEARGLGVESAFGWIYLNVHLPVLFASVAAFRVLAPDRYPAIRTTFILSFVPAVAIIGLYPLAPPHWLPAFGVGSTPTQSELSDTTGALFHNTTAAAASQHFGFAVFLAATSIWLFRRSPVAWATLVYPALVFAVIVGTGNHYVFDCLVGTTTFVLAWFAAARIHPTSPGRGAARPAAASAAVGYGFIAWGFVSLDVTEPATLRNLAFALVVAAGAAAVVAPRLAVRDLVADA